MTLQGKGEQRTRRQTEQEVRSPEASILFVLVIIIFGILFTKSPGKPFTSPVSNRFVASSKFVSTAPI